MAKVGPVVPGCLSRDKAHADLFIAAFYYDSEADLIAWVTKNRAAYPSLTTAFPSTICMFSSPLPIQPAVEEYAPSQRYLKVLVDGARAAGLHRCVLTSHSPPLLAPLRDKLAYELIF